ncbi:hypothetical protein AB4Z43_13560 [Mesorhizobium sp. 2RAF45]|uniref:hypothetical protein n=1 Tax=unclassified Mesorhizobium TaxID=325217 RepID=UPI001F41F50B|nr:MULTISPECIES: hypothetical protein [Mesorhizobium]
MAVKSQQIASPGIVEAYQAQLDTRDEAVLATTVARRTAPEAETQRGAVPPSVTANDNAPARAAGVSLLSFIPQQVPVPQNAAAMGMPSGRRRPANQSHAAATPNPEGLLVRIGFVSIITGLLAMMFGFVLLLLR